MIAGVVMSDYLRVFHLLDRLIIFWHLIRVNQSQFIYVCKSLKWIFMLYVEYQFMQERKFYHDLIIAFLTFLPQESLLPYSLSTVVIFPQSLQYSFL